MGEETSLEIGMKIFLHYLAFTRQYLELSDEARSPLCSRFLHLIKLGMGVCSFFSLMIYQFGLILYVGL